MSCKEHFSGNAKPVLGICIGGSTIRAVEVCREKTSGHGPVVIATHQLVHEGNPRASLTKLMGRLDPDRFDRIAVTGRRFAKNLRLSCITEPQAVEIAYRYCKNSLGQAPLTVVSAGGETFMAYEMDAFGSVVNVSTGSKCASGTGEFFLQQLGRMDVSLEQAATWAVSEAPYAVSGRCSVFCKSDCTHATNKGVPRSRVAAGLCGMMADKVLELLPSSWRGPVMLVGGVSLNAMMVHHLSKSLKKVVIPEHAQCFEALGAALWALTNKTLPWPGMGSLFVTTKPVFDILNPLKDARNLVTFSSAKKGRIKPGDRLMLGLDVGSTTTKAVLVRCCDKSIAAWRYLRTNGDPVGASKACYLSLLKQLKEQADPASVHIAGLGVCGSGRQIAGLFSLTRGVINEIIAHAAAAAHFDLSVDTLFEIGGQDAKYTYLTGGVPSDYAMNEACSAGTGSFLEEAAWETLGVKMEDIGPLAMKGLAPPNFNDQCAAFIASDIKNAVHEGIKHNDIVAGLVYSICMNYINRVKGARPVGERIFMQGGVCYNRAVPLAMASLLGKPITVPPEPGLMGAFGVALEVERRIEAGLIKEDAFDLEALAEREVGEAKPFVCKASKENCDRRCEIRVVLVDKKPYPFGGACSRYDSLAGAKKGREAPDLVSMRNRLSLALPPVKKGASKKIAFNRSFLIHSYFPLLGNFFSELGLETVLPETASQQGMAMTEAPFCFPAELAHGYFWSILESKVVPDYIFLPHFKALPDADGKGNSKICPFAQGEGFFLKAAFARQMEALLNHGVKVLDPLIDLTGGLRAVEEPLARCAQEMGFSGPAVERALEKGIDAQRSFEQALQREGDKVLENLAGNPDNIGVVIFGRAYNAFTQEAHKQIPRKLSSRGIPVLPLDCLDWASGRPKRHSYWGAGQRIMRAASLVKDNPQLFGLYISNFSCGPDSFLLTYFRGVMGRKPSLTLELDSHTADAGIETRIEAFLDVVAAYRNLEAKKTLLVRTSSFAAASLEVSDNRLVFQSPGNGKIPLESKEVTVLFPSMGHFSSQALAAAFRGMGLNAVVHPPADEAILKIGRAHASCKECLPLILTTGALINYVKNRRPGEKVVYFMPTASGPCRFGQYSVYLEDLISRLEIPDLALWSPSADNTYQGIGRKALKTVWRGAVATDVMEDIRSMLLANAQKPDLAMQVFGDCWEKILACLEKPGQEGLFPCLAQAGEDMAKIALKQPAHKVPVISLIGEIFVRRDALSRRNITERLAEEGFAVACAPVIEWIYYVRSLMRQSLAEFGLDQEKLAELLMPYRFLEEDELAIKSLLAHSGLICGHPVDLDGILEAGARHISPHLAGEAILTVGSALLETGRTSCGAIAIGPFGCMPNRLAESVLTPAMSRPDSLPEKIRLAPSQTPYTQRPFLAVESDGSPFPQLINAKLEAFCLRAKRLWEQMQREEMPETRPAREQAQPHPACRNP
jgi:predicted CoA-substrate-specific enzyme activase